jgi:type II secretory ATPase GspE/PulE/Tfp pilus assembly ATPase PilB-like protein
MARQHGMKTLLEDGVEKIKAGITTLSEVFRVTQEA